MTAPTCFELDGRTYDVREMIELAGPAPGWLGGTIDLVAVLADERGQLYVLEDSPLPDATGGPVGRVLTRCSPTLARVVVERFGLPGIYLEGPQP